MQIRTTLLMIALIVNGLSAFSQNYFPPKTGNVWATTSPASLGFCTERIDSLYNFLNSKGTKSFILLQDGKIVLEKYFGTFTQDSVWYWASAGKSLTGFMVGQAQEEGLLDIDSMTSKYLGLGWTTAPPEKEALITVRHQLTMTTGLDDTSIPTPASSDPNMCTDPACLTYKADAGTRWAYHTGAYRLLQDVIANTSNQTIQQFTKSRVFDHTGMTGLWFEDVFYSRARSMARFGLLIQRNGIWDGDTLLHDTQYFHDMTHPSQAFNKSYGYLWWLNGQPSYMVPGFQVVIPGKLIPNAPDDLIAALGKNDQKIHVVPSKGWVVIRQGNSASPTSPAGNTVPIVFDNQLWGYLNQLVCTPTATTEANENLLQIWPNPSSNGWNIRSEEPIDRVEMYDLRGALISSLATTGQSDIWIAPAREAGVFMVKIVAGKNVFWRKLMQ